MYLKISILISILSLSGACAPPDLDINQEANSERVPAAFFCPQKEGNETRKRQFLQGINYPWRIFGGDFGGIRAWSKRGVAGSLARHERLFKKLKKRTGAKFLRWWLWPDFRGDGIRFSKSGVPLGPGPTVAADLNAALALARRHKLKLILTIFSFDNFRPDYFQGRILVRNLGPIILKPTHRQAMLNNIIAPLAKIVTASPHKNALFAWDLINEPEWALERRHLIGPNGNPDFHPLKDIRPIPHPVLERFLSDMIRVLRRENSADFRPLITVGQVAWIWNNAWRRLPLDYYTFHLYPWIYKKSGGIPNVDLVTPAGKSGIPIVIGELPPDRLAPGLEFRQLVIHLHKLGYAGALPWSFSARPAGVKLTRFPRLGCGGE